MSGFIIQTVWECLLFLLCIPQEGLYETLENENKNQDLSFNQQILNKTGWSFSKRLFLNYKISTNLSKESLLHTEFMLPEIVHGITKQLRLAGPSGSIRPTLAPSETYNQQLLLPMSSRQ